MESPGEKFSNTVRVMSYNIQCIPSYIVPSTNLWTRKKVIREYLIRIVNKYEVDVLILQELMDKNMFRVLKMALADLLPYTTGTIGRAEDYEDWNTTHDCSEMPFHFTDGGVCIFSKYSIMEKHQLVFKNCRNTCALGAKGACLAVLDKNGQPLNVVGTHLQSFDGESMNVRKRQYMELLNWLENLFDKKIEPYSNYKASKQCPCVMGGDFNTCNINQKRDFDLMFGQSRYGNYVHFEPTVTDENKAPTFSTYTNDYCKLVNGGSYSHLYDHILTGPGVKVVQPQTVVRDKLTAPIFLVKFHLHCFGLFKKRIYNASDHYPIYAVLEV